MDFLEYMAFCQSEKAKWDTYYNEARNRTNAYQALGREESTQWDALNRAATTCIEGFMASIKWIPRIRTEHSMVIVCNVFGTKNRYEAAQIAHLQGYEYFVVPEWGDQLYRTRFWL